MSLIGNLAGTLVHTALGMPQVSQSQSNNSASNASLTSISTSPTDLGHLSSFGQLAGTLQQLQQSNPAKYQQVTQQIATNLQAAAQSAQASGDTATATKLNQLASDFNTASTSGQLPNLQDLAQAVGGHHGHHHHGGDSGSGGAVGQLLSSLQTTDTATQNNQLSPGAIIDNTLTSAGITIS